MDFDGISLVDEVYPVANSQQSLRAYTIPGIVLDQTLAEQGAVVNGATLNWFAPHNLTLSQFHFGVGIAAAGGPLTLNVKKNSTVVGSVSIPAGTQTFDVLASTLSSVEWDEDEELVFVVTTANGAYHLSVQVDFAAR